MLIVVVVAYVGGRCCGLSLACANIRPLSGEFEVLDPRVGGIDLERLSPVAPVKIIRMCLPQLMLIYVGIVLFGLVELLSAPN